MRTSIPAALGLAALFATHESHAEAPWVERPMTLHQLVFAGDVGVGLGHQRIARIAGIDGRDTGLGLNVEGALGVTERLELGIRTGIRFGADGRSVGADNYGRTLWTETYGTGGDAVANPELRLRWVAYSGSVAEVGLDGRAFLPVETGTNFGMMFGVPLAFHVADWVRIDTGAYVPLVFNDPTFHGVTVPGYFWFQTSRKVWLGPMASLRFLNFGNNANDTNLLLGFGMGYQVANAVDLKWWFLLPRVDDDVVRRFGAGFGVQFRIND